MQQTEDFAPSPALENEEFNARVQKRTLELKKEKREDQLKLTIMQEEWALRKRELELNLARVETQSRSDKHQFFFLGGILP